MYRNGPKSQIASILSPPGHTLALIFVHLGHVMGSWLEHCAHAHWLLAFTNRCNYLTSSTPARSIKGWIRRSPKDRRARTPRERIAQGLCRATRVWSYLCSVSYCVSISGKQNLTTLPLGGNSHLSHQAVPRPKRSLFVYGFVHLFLLLLF